MFHQNREREKNKKLHVVMVFDKKKSFIRTSLETYSWKKVIGNSQISNQKKNECKFSLKMYAKRVTQIKFGIKHLLI